MLNDYSFTKTLVDSFIEDVNMIIRIKCTKTSEFSDSFCDTQKKNSMINHFVNSFFFNYILLFFIKDRDYFIKLISNFADVKVFSFDFFGSRAISHYNLAIKRSYAISRLDAENMKDYDEEIKKYELEYDNMHWNFLDVLHDIEKYNIPRFIYEYIVDKNLSEDEIIILIVVTEENHKSGIYNFSSDYISYFIFKNILASKKIIDFLISKNILTEKFVHNHINIIAGKILTFEIFEFLNKKYKFSEVELKSIVDLLPENEYISFNERDKISLFIDFSF